MASEKNKLFISTAIIFTAMFTGAANAQDADSDVGVGADDTEARDVITVTARRREENIQEVPQSIKAFAEGDLQQADIRSLLEINKIVPSLEVRESAGKANQVSFTLRGIGVTDFNLLFDPGVGTYVNEVIQPRPTGFAGGFFDIEGVQVLYGPQGTLFGRNTVGGAILINTRKPVLNEFGGEAAFLYGNFDRIDAEGIVNIPIGENFALRAAIRHSQRDGFNFDVNNQRELDNANDLGWRISALWEPTDQFSNLLIVDGSDGNNNGAAYRLTAAREIGTVDPAILAQTGIVSLTGTGFLTAPLGPGAPSALDLSLALPDRQTGHTLPLEETQDFFRVTNIATYELNDNLTLKPIFSYSNFDTQGNAETDGTIFPLFEGFSSQEAEQISAELQLQGELLDGHLNFTTGLYYLREWGVDVSRNIIFGGAVEDQFIADTVNVGKSVFAQATYNVHGFEQLSLTAGFRYTDDKRSANLTNTNNVTGDCQLFADDLSTMPLDPCLLEQEASFQEPTWNVSLQYEWSDDLLTYVAHRRGYRAGGFNNRSSTPFTSQPFNNEIVDDIEFGLKSSFDLGGMPVIANIALYKTWYDDIQRTVARPIPNTNPPRPATVIENVAEATIQGLEAQITIEPFEGFSVNGNVGIADSEYQSFPTLLSPGPGSPRFGELILVDGAGDGGVSFGPAETSWNVNASYTVPLGDAGDSLDFFVIYRRTGDYQVPNISSPFDEPEGLTEGFGELDASVSWRNAFNSGVTLTGFVNNATDNTVFNNRLSIQQLFGFTSARYNDPRTYGVEARISF